MKNPNRNKREKARRQAEAKERQAERAKLTDAQQIKSLKQRTGKSKREIERLRRRIEK